LRDKPKFQDVVQEILDYVQGAEIIIHNAAFDVGFLNKELELAGQKPFTTYVDGVVDTLVMAKQMYPGKRNSLDALCDRLGVDNSGRTLHGALLDAELLADVYINLTRGQEALLIDAGGDEGQVGSVESVDLSGYVLPVIQANAQEQAAHQEQLAALDKASGGKTLWRQLEASS
jgi:DNA polymerase III subunit epsilon